MQAPSTIPAHRRAPARPAWPAAVTLARHGVRAASWSSAGPSCPALPRATGVSTRSMELMRAWGLEEQVRAGAVDVEWRRLVERDARAAAAGAPFRSAYPTREQSAV